MSLAVAAATAAGATPLADTIWYTVGRARGKRILEVLARFSLVHEASDRNRHEDECIECLWRGYGGGVEACQAELVALLQSFERQESPVSK